MLFIRTGCPNFVQVEQLPSNLSMQTMSAEPAVHVKAYHQQLILAHRSPQALDPPIAVPNGSFPQAGCRTSLCRLRGMIMQEPFFEWMAVLFRMSGKSVSGTISTTPRIWSVCSPSITIPRVLQGDLVTFDLASA